MFLLPRLMTNPRLFPQHNARTHMHVCAFAAVACMRLGGLAFCGRPDCHALGHAGTEIKAVPISVEGGHLNRGQSVEAFFFNVRMCQWWGGVITARLG